MRPRGVRNKASLKRQREIEQSGVTPLEFLIKTMRDPRKSFDRRFQAAISAAPYVHPKLSTVKHTGHDGGAIKAEVEVKATFDAFVGAVEGLARAKAGTAVIKDGVVRDRKALPTSARDGLGDVAGDGRKRVRQNKAGD